MLSFTGKTLSNEIVGIICSSARPFGHMETKMKSKFALAAMMTIIIAPAMMPSEVSAHSYRHHHRPYYYGHSGYHRHRCGGGNGVVGTIAGGVGGAVIGNAIGGGVLGTVAGGVGGGLLGRHFDKTHSRHVNGC